MSRRHVLVVRLDSLGDMVVCGPAIRAVAANADRVTVLAGPAGAGVAELLPGVDEVIRWRCPWILADPPPVDAAELTALVEQLRGADVDEALVLTSFHQSALPTALVLRLAGIRRIAGIGEDYPGALLDLRLSPPPDAPEPMRMLALAEAAGYPRPAADDGALRLLTARLPLLDLQLPYLVVHPGASAPARSYPAGLWADVVARLAALGHRVVVTGGGEERALVQRVAGSRGLPMAGRFDIPGLAAVIAGAQVLLVANTGPAHLAAALGTPVVSLFAPVVPAERWAPFTAHRIVLGDQQAPCRATRATACPVPGHPCLAGVAPDQVVAAAESLLVAEAVTG